MAGKGEGSRGGKIVGHTRTGRPVYAESDHQGGGVGRLVGTFVGAAVATYAVTHVGGKAARWAGGDKLAKIERVASKLKPPGKLTRFAAVGAVAYGSYKLLDDDSTPKIKKRST